MDAKIASVNFTKYIKRGLNRWQHCPVVRGKTGRVKQDLVLVDGRIEHHPEGYYSFDWREGGRRHRRALGKDAPAAQLALESIRSLNKEHRAIVLLKHEQGELDVHVRILADEVPENSLVSTEQTDKKMTCAEKTSNSWMCSATSVPSSAFRRTTHCVCCVL